MSKRRKILAALGAAAAAAAAGYVFSVRKSVWKKEEAEFLYLLLLFPEKFWKQINFYYNGKKSWMSMKNYDKLLKIESQEERREKFLSEAKGLLF